MLRFRSLLAILLLIAPALGPRAQASAPWSANPCFNALAFFSVGGIVLWGIHSSQKDAKLDRARVAENKAPIEQAVKRIDTYLNEEARLPLSLDTLPGDAPKDAWGHAIHYVLSDPAFTLYSPGPDGNWSTDDDLVYRYRITAATTNSPTR